MTTPLPNLSSSSAAGGGSAENVADILARVAGEISSASSGGLVFNVATGQARVEADQSPSATLSSVPSWIWIAALAVAALWTFRKLKT